MRLSPLALTMPAAFALLVAVASAADYYWTGAGSNNADGNKEWSNPNHWNLDGYTTGTIPTVGPTLGSSPGLYDNVFLNGSGDSYLGGITASSGTYQRINNLTVQGGSNRFGGRYTTDTPDLRIDGNFTVATNAQFFTGPYSPNRIDFHGAFSVGNGSVIGVNNSTSDSGYWNLANATSIELGGTTIRHMTNNWQWNAPRWDFGTATITLANTNTFNLHQDVVNEARAGVGSRGSLQQSINNLIEGTGGITKTGAGTLILNNAGNTYAGATTINAGILQANGGGAIGDSSAVSLANAQSSVNEGSVRATFSLNASETIGSLAGGGATGGNVILNGNTLTLGGDNASTTFGGVIAGSATGTTQGERDQPGSWSPSPYTPVGYIYAPEPALGSGSLVKTGSGTMTLTNTNLYEGTTTISQGYLAINGGIENGVAGALGQSNSAVILGDANTVAAASSDAANLGLFFNAGAGNQTFLASRGLDMSGSNVTGRTRIRLQGGTAADASQVHISGPITFGGRRYDIVAQHQQQLINITGKITGTAASVHWNGSNQGIGVVRLADATNDYTGDNTQTNGTLILAGNVAASGASPIGLGGLRMGDGAPHSLPMSNAASTNIALFMETAGTSFARPVTLSNVATYSGGNGVANGFIVGGLNTTGTVTFSGNLNSNTNANGDTNLTLVANTGGVTEFAGVVNDNADATRVTRVNVNQHVNHADLPGAGNESVGPALEGTVVFSGANTYEGRTAVFSGNLLANNVSDSATGSGPVEVHSGASLGGSGTIQGVMTIQSGAALSPGGDPAAAGFGIDTLAFGGDLNLHAGSTLLWDFLVAGERGEDYDSIDGTGLILPATGKVNLSIAGLDGYSLEVGDSFTLFDGQVYQDGSSTPFAFGQNLTDLFEITDNIGWSGGWRITAGSLILTAVPEPGAALLLLLALAVGLLVRGRRRA